MIGRFFGVWQKIKRRLDPPYFHTSDVQIGKGVRFGRNVEFNCKKVRIGDGCLFMDNIVVNADEFYMGDFGTVYSDAFFPGPGRITVGHNCWIGKGAIIDGQGGAVIGNNVCVSAYSQLWSHAKFGDIAYGARIHTVNELVLEDEVWIFPNCVIGPVTIKYRSLLLGGSILTKDTEPNTIYAGNPARTLNDKLDPPFRTVPVEESLQIISERVEIFCSENGVSNKMIQVVKNDGGLSSDSKITINVSDRTYTKHGTMLERKLIRFLLPDIKLLPTDVS